MYNLYTHYCLTQLSVHGVLYTSFYVKILDSYSLYVFAFFPYRYTYCSVSWALIIGDSI